MRVITKRKAESAAIGALFIIGDLRDIYANGHAPLYLRCSHMRDKLAAAHAMLDNAVQRMDRDTDLELTHPVMEVRT